MSLFLTKSNKIRLERKVYILRCEAYISCVYYNFVISLSDMR